MPSAAYFRRQADVCLRLSLIASDHEVSSRLIIMAREYMAMGEALEKGPGPSALPSQEGSPDVAPEAALGVASSTSDTPSSPAES